MFIRFTLFLFFYLELYTFEKYPNKPEALLLTGPAFALVWRLWGAPSCPSVTALGGGWSWDLVCSHPMCPVSCFSFSIMGMVLMTSSSVPSFVSSVSQLHLLSPSLLLVPLYPVWALTHLLPEALGRPWPRGPTAVSRSPYCHPS